VANLLLDAIENGIKLDKPLVWLDAEDYGSEVVLQGKPFPWITPTEFVASYGQLQNLLKPGVAPLNLARFLQAWLVANPSALNEMRGKKRLRYAIKKLLGMEGPRRLIREIVSALCDSLSQPVVLVLPVNGELINWANQAANGADAAEISEIDVDSVSVYLADFLRVFSGLNVAGVLVQLAPGSSVNSGLLELYSPIINVAKHYHWALGLQVEAPEVVDDTDEKIDFVISDHDAGNGVLLGKEFWSEGQRGAVDNGFYFSTVPAKLQPELVLERLAALAEQ